VLLTGFEMKRLQLKCKPLDDLLGGGIESNTLTEIYGEAGSGKTNLCLQASRECAAAGDKIAYIDAEGVSVERLGQLCEDYDYKKILLIVVDTFNMFYRIKLENDEEGAERSLNRQITNLQLAARKNNLFVMLTGQVYSIENDDVKPFAGRGVEHMVKTILKLEKVGRGKRQATIIKHRSQPERKKALFIIAAKGLE